MSIFPGKQNMVDSQPVVPSCFSGYWVLVLVLGTGSGFSGLIQKLCWKNPNPFATIKFQESTLIAINRRSVQHSSCSCWQSTSCRQHALPVDNNPLGIRISNEATKSRCQSRFITLRSINMVSADNSALFRSDFPDASKVNFSEHPVHALTSVLKTLFRDMREPLMPYDLYRDFISISGWIYNFVLLCYLLYL